MKKTLFILAILCVALPTLKAQQAVQQQLVWLRYFNQWNFSDKLALHTEFEERRYASPFRIHQRFLPRLSLNYKASENVTFNVGGVHFQQYLPHDPNESAELFVEWRPHQYVMFTQSLDQWSFASRLMLEQRFMQENTIGPIRYRFNLRPRMLFRVSRPLWKSQQEDVKRSLSAFAFEEILIQAGEDVGYNVFDQNRIGGGLSFVLNKHFKFDLSYFHWYQQLGNGTDFFSRSIVHLTLFHTI